MSWFEGENVWIETVYGYATAWLDARGRTDLAASRVSVTRDPGVNQTVGLLVRVFPGVWSAHELVDLRGYIRQALPLDVWVRVVEGV